MRYFTFTFRLDQCTTALMCTSAHWCVQPNSLLHSAKN